MFSDGGLLRREVTLQRPPLGKIRGGHLFPDVKGGKVYFSLVDNVAFFESHHDAIAVFLGRYVSNWTVALNTWNTTRDSEDTRRRQDTVEKSRMAQTSHLPDKG